MFVFCPFRGSVSLRRVSVRQPSPKGSSKRSPAGASRVAARSRTMPEAMQVKTSMTMRIPRLCFSERLSRCVFSLSLAVDFISISLDVVKKVDYYREALPFHGTQVPVFQNLKMLRKEPLRVVVRADRALQAAARHQGAFGDVASPDDHLPGVGGDSVGIAVEIAAHAVHHYRLVDVPADEPVVEPFLVPVPVIPVQAFVGQVHRPVYVRLDGRLVGGHREEQLVQAAHVFPGFHRTVPRGVLRECHDERLPLVQHVDLLPLRLGEPVGLPDGETGQEGAGGKEHEAEQADLPERGLDVFQTLEFHILR